MSFPRASAQILNKFADTIFCVGKPDNTCVWDIYLYTIMIKS